MSEKGRTFSGGAHWQGPVGALWSLELGDLAGILALASETGGKPPVRTMVAGERSQCHYASLFSMFVIPNLIPAAA